MAIDIKEVLAYYLGGNTLYDYSFALIVFIISIIVLKVFKSVILSRLKKLAKKTKTDIDDLIVDILDKMHWPFYFLIALYLAVQTLILPDYIANGIYYAFIIFITYYIVRGIQSIIDFFTHRVIDKRIKKKADISFVYILSRFFKISLWLIAFLLILSNLGYNISTLLAGLGIGGIAIALAIQNILGDIFAAFSLYFDRPFEVGDFIIIDNDKGIVKKIGIKSTRIQTLEGQELVISNRELTDKRINNYKKMEKRRVAFTVGVTYQTPTRKLEKIPRIIESILRKMKELELDRVHFRTFGPYSLDFEIVYYLGTRDFKEYMDTQQKINLQIKKAFEKEKIEFAYPTQTVFVEK